MALMRRRTLEASPNTAFSVIIVRLVTVSVLVYILVLYPCGWRYWGSPRSGVAIIPPIPLSVLRNQVLPLVPVKKVPLVAKSINQSINQSINRSSLPLGPKIIKLHTFIQRWQDDNKNGICDFEGVGRWQQRGKLSQNAVFFLWETPRQ